MVEMLLMNAHLQVLVFPVPTLKRYLILSFKAPSLYKIDLKFLTFFLTRIENLHLGWAFRVCMPDNFFV